MNPSIYENIPKVNSLLMNSEFLFLGLNMLLSLKFQ